MADHGPRQPSARHMVGCPEGCPQTLNAARCSWSCSASSLGVWAAFKIHPFYSSVSNLLLFLLSIQQLFP